MVVEYRDVPIGFFKGWCMRFMLRGRYRIRRTERKIYVYQMHVRLEEGVYLHVFYRNFREIDGGLYTLRLETRPEHFERFTDILGELRHVASGIDFVSCDLAYDVPYALGDVFVAPNDMRRKLRKHNDTRYFGLPHQRKQNGYCRVYDKALELWQRHGIEYMGSLTRIEMVYKPETRIELADVGRYPPEQNRHYFASVVEDWSVFTAKLVERIRNWQLGEETYTRHVRETIKKTLAERLIDFNRLASERWKEILKQPCAAILGHTAT
ncbi:replication initiation factor family protein [Paenibacillus oryzisoli]|uniref:Replication initiation factor family protein n=2 Tax=Paenibacillus oryzisoli TaxID=1850517 RepID=A0A198A3Q8_9BACL|nr:replication initiation factor family protein [Paenibacillus oryzisoli]